MATTRMAKARVTVLRRAKDTTRMNTVKRKECTRMGR
jgi:hypothetical protein